MLIFLSVHEAMVDGSKEYANNTIHEAKLSLSEA